jgi:hypothetical protein
MIEIIVWREPFEGVSHLAGTRRCVAQHLEHEA